ncbi:hypothetical protein MC885_015037 [Smutsia gigantea]|nr:hypothetical protein MC885_015037 [Smutsia gigantea]
MTPRQRLQMSTLLAQNRVLGPNPKTKTMKGLHGIVIAAPF